MTRDEILNMEAGREMDALVVEKIMGEPYPDRFAHPKWWGLRYDMGHEVWEPMLFSTNIKMAWEVVETLKALGFSVLRLSTGDILGDWWQFHCADAYREIVFEDSRDYFANAETPALAVCRAALLATLEGR